MTPDDTPVPGDDAIARAAREGLSHLAGSHAPFRLDWESVATGARRLRQRRLIALVAACAIVVASSGAAVAATRVNGDHVTITGPVEPASTTTTTADAPSSTTGATSTTTTAPAPSGTAGLTPNREKTTTPLPAPAALPTDFTGTITTQSTTWTIGQSEPVSLTVRNVSDHAVTLPYGLVGMGLYADFLTNLQWTPSVGVETMAAGEVRTWTATLAPNNEMIGTVPLRAAFVRGIVMDIGGYADAFLDGVPAIEITTIPPGWATGDPLDPSQGTWKAELSVDAAQAVVGDPITLHVNLTNLDDAPHKTEGYGSLAAYCLGNRQPSGAYLDAATLAPGATQSFEVQYTPLEYQIGTLTCSLAISYNHETEGIQPGDADLQSDPVRITVLPASSTTSTTTTTTVTSP